MAKERRDNKRRKLLKGEYQNSDGRYMYRYTDNDGVSRFVYSWTLTQTDRTPNGKKKGLCLRELEKQIQKDLLDGIQTFDVKKKTLNDFFDDYIKNSANLKSSTKTNYVYKYNRHIRNTLGNHLFCNIKYSDVKNFYIKLIKQTNMSKSSLAIVNTILANVFKIAVRDCYIRVSPIDGALVDASVLCTSQVKKVRSLSEQETRDFFEFVKTSKYKKWLPLFIIILYTGCRIGEVLGLLWEDCDFDNNVIYINHSISYIKYYNEPYARFHMTTPKTESGKRVVPMFDFVREVLLEIKKEQPSAMRDFKVDGYSGFVFVNSKGNPYMNSSVHRILKTIVDNYNKKELSRAEETDETPTIISHFSAHNLRHTFCTRLCEMNVNLKVIQEVMGHSDFAITMNVYNEAMLDKKQEAFNKVSSDIKFF